MAMSTGYRSSMYKRNIYRSEISQAWYPTQVECCVAVGKSAQFRRALLLKAQVLRNRLSEKRLRLSDLLIALGERLSVRTNTVVREQSHTLSELELPITPRVRILETIDLSSSNIEHFLGEDALVPVTPKLSALAPIAEMQMFSSSRENVGA